MQGAEQQQKVVYYTQLMFNFLESVVAQKDCDMDAEFKRNLLDLFVDIVMILGHQMAPALRQSNVPRFFQTIIDADQQDELRDAKARFREVQSAGIF